MRKNKLTGAIPKAGRKKSKEEKYTVHLTITKKAKLILDKQKRMEKGKFVSGLIEGSELNILLNYETKYNFKNTIFYDELISGFITT